MAGHHHPDGSVWIIYLVANVAIAGGYGIMPVLVLRYLPLTRTVLIFGGGFFALCGLTHLSMAFGHTHAPPTWFWAVEHLLQAIATWGFIVSFHQLLRRADNRRKARGKPRARRTARGAGAPDGGGGIEVTP